MKEMFHENENLPKEISEEKKKLQKQNQSTPLHSPHYQQQHNHHHGKQNKFYATSISVRAVFSEETNPQTRKFLGMNSTAPYPMIQGKSKRKEKGDGVDAEPSQISNLTPLTSSLSSLRKSKFRIFLFLLFSFAHSFVFS